jgi:hypothetical protein
MLKVWTILSREVSKKELTTRFARDIRRRSIGAMAGQAENAEGEHFNNF